MADSHTKKDLILDLLNFKVTVTISISTNNLNLDYSVKSTATYLISFGLSLNICSNLL